MPEPDPHVVDAPSEVFRVARRSSVLRYSEIEPADAGLPDSGNRYDVPGGGVLYAASEARTCFAETLARFRPSPRIREVVSEERDGFMVIGGITSDWRMQRVIASLRLQEPLSFLDVEDPATHAHLSDALSADLVALGYGADDLDFGDMCNRDRRLSRRIAAYAYTASDLTGEPIYSGIRYGSRFDPSQECWAIFSGTDVIESSRRTIDPTDPDFVAVVEMWGLRAF